ncbi:MAG TPA: hypothetical protein VED84_03545 [Acidimicrobiales bacterium]|nr:hypothetical protein [Acidimicrobiales bacterium]
MKARRGWRVLRIGVVTGLASAAVLAAARIVPRFVAHRSYRRLAAAKATEDLWPPVPSRPAEPVRVSAPLAQTGNDGEGSGGD